MSVDIMKILIKEYLMNTIRSLTFRYSLKWETLFEIIHENPGDGSEDSEDDVWVDGKMLADDKVNYYKQLYRLFEHLNDKNNKGTPKTKLDHPKIYDKALLVNGTKLYNSVARMLDYPVIEEVYTDDKIIDILVAERILDQNIINLAVKYLYPYAFLEERDGINFLEAIILSVLVTVIHHAKRFERLNKIPEEKDKDYYEKIKTLIKKKCLNPQYIESLTRTIFYELDGFVSNDHTLQFEKMLRETILLDKYKNRKDAFRAISTPEHCRNIDDVIAEIEETQDFKSINLPICLNRLYYVIIPLAEYITNENFTHFINLTEHNSYETWQASQKELFDNKQSIIDSFIACVKENITVEDEDFENACLIAGVVNIYTSHALATALLSTELPEFKIVI